MVRDGIYYTLALLLVAAVLYWLTGPLWTLIPLALAAFFLWFFRDPERPIPSAPGLVVSPADGKVTAVATVQLEGQLKQRISIFLNVFDVHVNRSPIAGRITAVKYQPGKFGNAMSALSAEANEQNMVTVEGEGRTVVFKQIAGLLARRIVFNKAVGQQVARGERVGMIKFGSRVDVVLPMDVSVAVKVGDRVKGGESVLAQPAAPLPGQMTGLRNLEGR